MAKSLTAAQIDKMTLPELRTAAGKVLDADDIKGLRKAQLQEALKDYYSDDEAPVADDELDDDELDDDELDEHEGEVGHPEADEDDELDDELDDEVDEPEPPKKKAGKTKPSTPATEPSGETYTAKQVATRIGTDAKTLRKFFRSPASTVEAVGQGGRYEFDKADLPKIKEEFEKWNTSKPARTPKAEGEKKPKGKREAPASAIVEDDEELEIEDDEVEVEEPSKEDLDELDDEELTLDDDDELDDDELDD